MTAKPKHPGLTKRERQIMDALYRRGAATVAEVLEDLPNPPTYSTVRAMLARLEEKGHVSHRQDGPRYVYRPTLARQSARQSALERLVETFFDGSEASTIAAILDRESLDLEESELDRLSDLIERARRKRR
jgi:predicted transcriptional regulator